MGEKITRELLKKRAEHNEGDLSTLKEITLHQFDIEKIENLDIYCKQLEILYLQNNQIQRIENLNKLKSLRYLQLAINNIQKIENLEGCECLEKLDLTVNFVEDPLDVDSLAGLEFFRELYLIGNPCYQKPGYREFVICALPKLKILDSVDIERSERILALQNYKDNRERFTRERNERLKEKGLPIPIAPAAEEADNVCYSPEELEKKKEEFQTKPIAHTPEARLQAARDLAKLKNAEKEPKPKPKKKLEADVLYASDGRILQKNQGKWEFKFDETPRTITLDVEISKFVDTSLIDVDVHPTWIRVTVKDKILQLLLDEEVKVDGVLCERSKASGHLVVTMLKAKAAGQDIVQVRKHERVEREQREKEKEQEKRSQPQRNRRYERLFEPTEAIELHNILEKAQAEAKKVAMAPNGILDVNIAQHEIKSASLDFEDDPEVPPLC